MCFWVHSRKLLEVLFLIGLINNCVNQFFSSYSHINLFTKANYFECFCPLKHKWSWNSVLVVLWFLLWLFSWYHIQSTAASLCKNTWQKMKYLLGLATTYWKKEKLLCFSIIVPYLSINIWKLYIGSVTTSTKFYEKIWHNLNGIFIYRHIISVWTPSRHCFSTLVSDGQLSKMPPDRG